MIFKIQSNDVIHSFWIPALAGKMDAVPGRTHERVLQSNEVGIFEGQCTEYCGLSHGVMRMQVKALDTADYDEWIQQQTTPPAQPAADDTMAIAGQELFVTQCSFCHQVNGLTPDSKAPFEYAEEPDPDYGKTVDITIASGNAPNLTHFMTPRLLRRCVSCRCIRPTAILSPRSCPVAHRTRTTSRHGCAILRRSSR